MPRYTVVVTATQRFSKSFKVTAKNPVEADRKALEKAQEEDPAQEWDALDAPDFDAETPDE